MNKHAFQDGFIQRWMQLEKRASPPIGYEQGAAPQPAAMNPGPPGQGGSEPGLMSGLNEARSDFSAARKLNNLPRVLDRAGGLVRGARGLGGVSRVEAAGELFGPGANTSKAPSLMARAMPAVANSRLGQGLGALGKGLGTAAMAGDTAFNLLPSMQGTAHATRMDDEAYARGGGHGVNTYANDERRALGQTWQKAYDDPHVMNTLGAVGQTLSPYHGGMVAADSIAGGAAGGIHAWQNPVDAAVQRRNAQPSPGGQLTGDRYSQYEQAMAQQRIANGVGTAADQQRVSDEAMRSAPQQPQGYAPVAGGRRGGV